MAKFQLTICTDYVKDWGLHEGVREAIQNALDGQQDGCPMTIHHSASSDSLVIENQGARLDRSVWLLGNSSKSAGAHRGLFGEGLKLGTLALVRAGHSVTFVNDDENWAPVLADSEAFPGQQVLTISTRARSATGKFSVLIGGIDADQWGEIRSIFLDLNPDYVSDKKEVRNSVERLEHPSFNEKLFVKGIAVDSWPGLQYGYNFTNVTTDRDRRMVSQFAVEVALSDYWSSAARDPEELPLLIKLLKANARDVKGVHYYISGTEGEILRKDFLATHGEKAWPVSCDAEYDDAKHWGLVPVLVPEAYLKALRAAGMTIEAAHEAHRTAVLNTISNDELRSIERSILEEAMQMVCTSASRKGLPNPRPITRVVEFSDPATLGMHVHEEGKASILLARPILTSFETTLRVLVHETAHFVGRDGQLAHERAEGELFSDMVCRLLHSAAH
jgi:hypothetical protein